MSTNKWALYLGCVIPNRLPFMELAIRETLHHFKIPIQEIPGFTCCPNPLTLPHLDHKAALAIGARNLAIAEEHSLPILTPCHGCFETLKGSAKQLNENKELRTQINEILTKTGHEYKGTTEVKHFIEFLYEDIGPDTIAESVIHPLSHLNVALHTGCHIIRPSNLLEVDNGQRPTFFQTLIRAIGANPVSYKDEMDCCGYGTRPADGELSLKISGIKLSNMKAAGADALVVICPACFLQFDLLQRLALKHTDDSTPLPVFYYPELLNIALGTPPAKLGFNLHRVKVDDILGKIFSESSPVPA